ncbi:MAG: hypothetical protein DCC58_12370 [Chloroflexi bacterium]|nr:MAG: hypothetical protein DCC58_12370 [Chloroflexota bacterium]
MRLPVTVGPPAVVGRLRWEATMQATTYRQRVGNSRPNEFCSTRLRAWPRRSAGRRFLLPLLTNQVSRRPRAS